MKWLVIRFPSIIWEPLDIFQWGFLQVFPRSITNFKNDPGLLTLTLGRQEKSMKKTFFRWRVSKSDEVWHFLFASVTPSLWIRWRCGISVIHIPLPAGVIHMLKFFLETLTCFKRFDIKLLGQGSNIKEKYHVELWKVAFHFGLIVWPSCYIRYNNYIWNQFITKKHL